MLVGAPQTLESPPPDRRFITSHTFNPLLIRANASRFTGTMMNGLGFPTDGRRGASQSSHSAAAVWTDDKTEEIFFFCLVHLSVKLPPSSAGALLPLTSIGCYGYTETFCFSEMFR